MLTSPIKLFSVKDTTKLSMIRFILKNSIFLLNDILPLAIYGRLKCTVQVKIYR